MSRKNKGFKTDRLDDEMARSIHNSFPRAGPTKTQQIAALQATIEAQQARIEEARELLSHRDTQILWSDFPGSWCVRRNTWLSTPPVKVPTDPCVLHGVWPCRMCGTKHYAGCECFYCRSAPPAELTKTE